jgi:hypothetical protein
LTVLQDRISTYQTQKGYRFGFLYLNVLYASSRDVMSHYDLFGTVFERRITELTPIQMIEKTV